MVANLHVTLVVSSHRETHRICISTAVSLSLVLSVSHVSRLMTSGEVNALAIQRQGEDPGIVLLSMRKTVID